MKLKKRIVRVLSLMLCAVLLAASLTACGDVDERGAYVNVYLGAEVRSWDPAIGFTDAAAVKYFSLVYEGLMTYDDNGKVVEAGAKEVNVKTNSDGETVMEIRVDGYWSDGRPVSANDYIYSFKRILDPDFTSPAKALLYPIKNAQAIVRGEATIDDLCLYAPRTQVLQIIFEDPEYDTDRFLENLASMALVPVREDMVEVYDDWEKTAIDIQTNGPFTVKTMDSDNEGGTLVLERNAYYKNASHNIFYSDDVKYKYVTPYRLMVHYGYDAAEREEAFQYNYKDDGEVETSGGNTLSEAADQLMYLSGLRGDTELGHVKTADLMSTYCYYFNTTKAPFDKKEVRQALSMAIDRNAIAALYYEGQPATGLIPNGVYYTDHKDTFRETVGDVLNVEGDVEGAKALLREAGVSSGSFTLSYRDINRNGEIAEMVKDVWEQLGFDVELEALDYEDYRERLDLYIEGVSNFISEEYTDEETGETITKYYLVEKTEGELLDFENGKRTEVQNTEKDYSPKTKEEEPEQYYDFDVIGLDFQAINADPLYSLALFTPTYSGNRVMTEYADYDARPHMTGYNSDAYNALIDEAFAATDREEQAAILADAEEMLLDDMPVCPIIFNVDSYVAASEISNYKYSTPYGGRDFTKLKLKNFDDYIPAEYRDDYTVGDTAQTDASETTEE